MIAVVSMLIDHIAAVPLYYVIWEINYGRFAFLAEYREILCDLYDWMRRIGRMAFPLYIFLLVEGFFHTRRVQRYASHLLMGALVSEIPFDLAFDRCIFKSGNSNVFWTLLIGLMVIWGLQVIQEKTTTESSSFIKKDMLTLARGIGWMTVVVIGVGMAEFVFHCDYGGSGVAAIVVLYLLHGHPMAGYASAIFVLGVFCDTIEFVAIWMLIPLYCYNGERGRQNKIFFYLFYPVHFIVLVGITASLGIPMVEQIFG